MDSGKSGLFQKLIVAAVGLLAFCWAGDLHAQSGSITFDPYEIKKRIAGDGDFNVADLWQTLGISARLETVYSRMGIVPDDPAIFEKCRNCQAEIHPLKWPGKAETILALKIYQDMGFCRFLLFRQIRISKPGKAYWQFIGHTDHDFSRYYLPKHRTEKLGSGYYFVINAQGASGTGVSLEYERWYELTSDGIKEVLSLPVRGHECAGVTSLCRTFSAHVEKAKLSNLHVRIVFKVQYKGNRFLVDGKSFEDIFLFAEQKNAVYVRNKTDSDFTLSPFESEITAEEIRLTYSIGELSCKDFFHFNSVPLKRPSVRSDDRRRLWLKRYLQECEPSAARNHLMEVPVK